MDYQNTALILCDMWDAHWCKGAAGRVRQMARRMNSMARYMRDHGSIIVHCPADTMAFYEGTEMLNRTRELAKGVELEKNAYQRAHIDSLPAIGVDPNRVECDCGPVKCPTGAPWTRQIDLIDIESGDLIGEDEDVLKALKALGIEKVYIAGVHTNLCVLERPYGIKNMLCCGFSPVLVRDMTDCMAPSDEPPYENHFNALEKVVRYIEHYLCPTVTSGDLMEDGMRFSFSEDPDPIRFLK